MANANSDGEPTIWGVHAGKTGDADALFLKQGFIAIGWSGMGDLSKLKPDREAFKAKVVEAYPDSKPGAIPTNGGQIYRFVHPRWIAQNRPLIDTSKPATTVVATETNGVLLRDLLGAQVGLTLVRQLRDPHLRTCA